MTRAQLEHILRASAGITGASEFVVIGSQAILGQFPDAPGELLRSIEADIFTFRSPQDADLIDGSIGEGSPFQSTFGYHAHGVGLETAVLPSGWRDRLVRVSGPSTQGATGLCLEVHDLAASKLIAGRDKDREFVASLVRHSMVRESVLRERLASVATDPRVLHAAQVRLDRLFPASS